jgi:hypothetical protein
MDFLFHELERYEDTQMINMPLYSCYLMQCKYYLHYTPVRGYHCVHQTTACSVLFIIRSSSCVKLLSLSMSSHIKVYMVAEVKQAVPQVYRQE